MKNKIKAAIRVVIFASKIALKAWEKPVSIALILDLPRNCSSLILSKISTLASTAIPTVKAIPAIPGNVSVAFRRTMQETRNKILEINQNKNKKITITELKDDLLNSDYRK